MQWLEVSVRCGRAAQEAVAEALNAATAGAAGDGAGVAIDDPAILLNRERREWDYCDLEPGDPDFVKVTAYLPGLDGWEDSLARVRESLAVIREIGLGPVEEPVTRWTADEDWAENWKRYYRPLRIGQRLMVVPAWEEYQPEPDDVTITLDPGMAFGTGTHATTRLCLEALEELGPKLGRDDAGKGWRVLDIGTGSGILAIAAAKLGAASVEAIDNDPAALEAAARNIVANGLGPPGPVRIRLGDLERWKACGGTGPFDAVVANIIADVAAALAPAVRQLLRPGGVFVAGGIIESREEAVFQALALAGFEPAGRRSADGWVVLEARA